ncbi:Cytosine/adenosine deaminase [Pandoravirus neocaledonia]|uniref:Cytosine/adenosine deaminase n=1 Tax=Pandoravirus neocaledonia TaxID=2107708 RepID=A0A2U7UCW3_9VIRU|nr:Cytosine/adenosine deaminase [Pandoravirus neocaledonia]AVK76308.1 Cytosine/adenosine deaminase [Pandoravirus neocaledonia]
MRTIRPSRLLVRGVTLAGRAGLDGPTDVLLERGAQGKILAIGSHGLCDAVGADPSAVHVLNAQGLVAMPGIMNAHVCNLSDASQVLGANSDAIISDASNGNNKMQAPTRSTHALTLAKSMATMVGMLKTGTTSALFPVRAHPEAVVEAAVRVGMRAIVAVTAQDSAVRGDPATAAAVDVDRVMSLARRWRPHPTVTLALGLDATLAQCRPAYLDAIVGLSAKYDLHVHARVDRRDAPSYARSVTRLSRLVLCGTRLSVAVCDSAAGAGVSVPVCARVPPSKHLSDRRRSLWPLAAAVGGGLTCPFERMRRLASIDGTTGPHDAWRLMARAGRRERLNNNNNNNIDDTVGISDILRVGDAADVVLLDPSRLASARSRPLSPEADARDRTNDDSNICGATVCAATQSGIGDSDKKHADPFSVDSIVRHCRSSDVACVIVAGRIVVALGAATLVDERAIPR